MNFRCKRASVRAAALCLAALLALSLLAGCAKPNPQSVLYRRGMSVVYTMCDMASSDYLRLLYGERAADMLDKTQEDGTTLRGQMDAAHYKTADAVFLLDATVPMSDGTTDGLSEELQELYRIQSAVGLSGYLSLNAGANSDWISLSAMLTATELRRHPREHGFPLPVCVSGGTAHYRHVPHGTRRSGVGIGEAPV